MAQLITALSSNSYKATSDCPHSECQVSPTNWIKKLHIRGKVYKSQRDRETTRSVKFLDLRREKVEISGNGLLQQT